MTSHRYRPSVHTLSWVVLVIFFATLYGTLATYGTGEFYHRELRGDVYDSLAKHLLKGSAEVDTESINWEGFKINGKTFMYFGPFPALLRIPLNALFPSMYGEWSRLSCLVAALLCIASVAVGVTHLRRCRPSPGSVIPGITLVLATGLCSPIVYLVSCPRVYHEAILWGLAASLAALPAIVHLVFRNPFSWRAFAWVACMGAAALLSRITFGLPLYGAWMILGLRAIAISRPVAFGPILSVIFAGTPALGGGCFQLWYNWARFGSPLKAIDYDYFYVKPAEIGGEFHVGRLYDTLFSYFGVTSELFSSVAPFFLVSAPVYARPKLFFGWRETNFPLTLCCLPILLMAVAGLWILVKERRWMGLMIMVLFVGEALLVASYFFVSWRYSTDFLPLIIFAALSAVFLHTRPIRLPVLALLPSAVMTLGATLSWHLFYATPDVDIPAEWKRFLQLSLMPDLSESRMQTTPQDRAIAMLPSFQVVGDPRDVRRNVAHNGAPLSLSSRWFATGVGLRFRGAFTISVPPNAERLTGVIALPDSDRSCNLRSAKVVITRSNGQTLFEGRDIRGNFETTILDLPLTAGDGSLRFELRDLDGRPDCDYVNLLDLRIRTGADHSPGIEEYLLRRVDQGELDLRYVPGEVFMMSRGVQVDGGKLKLDDIESSVGFGLHAPSLIRLSLGSGVRSFGATVGIPQSFRACKLSDFLLTVMGGSGRFLWGPVLFNEGTGTKELLFSTHGESELIFLLSPGRVPDCDALNVMNVRFGYQKN